MIKLPKITDFNFQGKTILVRVDVDVPIVKGRVEDDTRIKVCLSTTEYLLKNKARVILMGHLGRPGGKEVEELSLRPVAQKFKELLNYQLPITNCQLQDFQTFQIFKDFFLLENLRFYLGEENNEENFAKKLANLGDFYVNEAFATSHRKHASIVGVPKFLPSSIGFRFLKEVENLSLVLENPRKPVVFVIGGAKVATKLPLVVDLVKKADFILLGGLLPSTQNNKLRTLNNKRVVWGRLTEDGLDIRPGTIEKFTKIIQEAGTVVWNGPLGKFEEERGLEGTRRIAKAMAETKAFKVVGGGDTIRALNKFGLLSKIDFVSLGGGAMLEFLAKGTLPGIEALR